jgi:hypothetical protein
MKRVQLVVLFLIAAAFFAGTRALAAGFPTTKTGSAELTPVGDEPGASGHATLSAWWDSRAGLWLCSVSVSCEGLTPGATYCVVPKPYYALYYYPGPAKASEDGRLVAKCTVKCLKGYFFLSREVTVMRSPIPSVGNDVLSGSIVWR